MDLVHIFCSDRCWSEAFISTFSTHASDFEDPKYNVKTDGFENNFDNFTLKSCSYGIFSVRDRRKQDLCPVRQRVP